MSMRKNIDKGCVRKPLEHVRNNVIKFPAAHKEKSLTLLQLINDIFSAAGPTKSPDQRRSLSSAPD